MRAVVCRSFGPAETLRVEEYPPPELGPGQVLVQVHAAGVNFTDLLAVEGRSQLARQLPMIPGAEASGVVLAVGAGVSRHHPGDRVLGCSTHGAFAEEALFAEDELARLPEDMDLRTAAVFYIAAMTARYALQDRARLAPGEILLVLGAGGGAGLAAVQVGKALGARVIAAASSREKCELALAHGADEVVRYPAGPLDLDAQKALTAELLAHAARPKEKTQSIGRIKSVPTAAGYHVILDGVGGTYTEPALRALGWEGRYVSIGFAAGMARIALGPALFRNADILCIQPSADEHRLPGRNPRAMQTLFEWYREGKLSPCITHTLPLEHAAQALNLLRTRTATGRIVLTTSPARGRE
jgi:NADPH:quinone reductase